MRILCEAFQVDTDGRTDNCERRLIEEGHRLNQLGKMLAPIIDDAHLMEVDALRRLRLLFEDFPKNHNLVLIAQPDLLSKLSLTINDDIKSRVTYSVMMKKLAPEDVERFIYRELDRVALAHSTFSEDALALIVRSRRRTTKSQKPRASNDARSSPRPHQDGRTTSGKPRADATPLAQGPRPLVAVEAHDKATRLPGSAFSRPPFAPEIMHLRRARAPSRPCGLRGS